MRRIFREPRRRAEPGAASLTSPLWRLVAGLMLMLLAWTFLLASETGLQVRDLDAAGLSMRFVTLDPERRVERYESGAGRELTADGRGVGSYPGVIVTHGFAGSARLMQAYAQVFARAGYGVLLLDLPGHGGSRRPLAEGELARALDRAYRALTEQPEIDTSRIGIVGHSMGAGAALDAAVRDPQRYRATVAISPVRADVGPLSPRNLQLQAGTWEEGFLESARGLLEQAGGPGEDFETGRARALVTVEYADHVSILFRDASHRAALRWLDRGLGGADLAPVDYRDRRIVWWLLHLVGAMVFATSMAPGRWQPSVRPRGPGWLPAATLILAPLVATGAVAALARITDVGVLAGMAVGPALALWFLAAGLPLFLGPFQVRSPGARHLVWGLGAFVLAWLVVGLAADLVWLDWGLAGRRLWLWPVFGLACVPWFAGAEAVRLGSRGFARFGWWLAESLAVGGALFVAGSRVAGLGTVVLVLPVLPLFLGVAAVLGGRVDDPWPAGIGAGLFFGWLLATVFPVVA